MATNDNTLQTLGFIYQTYIALIKCLEMNENDKVIIEHLGDITFISTSRTSQQIEVKHHIKPTILSDRSHEIWNSVWNWYNNFDEYNDINELILFTTSKLSQKSVLKQWNDMDTDNRYKVFRSIGNVNKQNEKQFRAIYNKIFVSNHCVKKLKSVLSKIKILSEQQTIKSIINQYYQSTFKFLGDSETMEQFVCSLIGVLLTIPIKQKKWEITFKEFDAIFKNFATRFSNTSEIPLQLSFEDYEPTAIERKCMSTMDFVREINKIDLSNEVTDAINDYCRTNKTIITYFDNNIVKSKDLKDYRNQLNKTLSLSKKLYKLNCKDAKNKILTESQKLFYQSMKMEARHINGVSNNRDFFQRGIIHSIVDDGDLTWYIGDSE